jgi:DNA-directed RNA polymerase subunit RPC12/RpoP
MSNTNTRCPRCLSKFHIISPEPSLSCPFCGFSFKVTELRRKEERISTRRDCNLDISKDGVGVKMMGSMHFDKNDTLRVSIKDFEMESSAAKIVWVKMFGRTMSRAGLKFI